MREPGKPGPPQLSRASLSDMTAARKLSLPLPQSAPPRSRMYELMMREMESADIEGFVQAAEKYGDDHERELADLRAGTHPLQRHKHAG